MKQIFNITECAHRKCPFHHISMDGAECTHPYWNDKEAYENLIGGDDKPIPDMCPLRKEKLIIEYLEIDENREL